MEEKHLITPQEYFDSCGKYVVGNSLLLMRGKNGGSFNVRFLQDVGTKQGWLQLVIVYPNGLYKEVVLCTNVFKEANLDTESIGVVEKTTNDKTDVITVERGNSLNYGDYRMLEQYETPQMPIPAKALWKLIIDNYESIPVVKIYQNEDVEGIYWELYRLAHEAANSGNFCNTYRENDVRFLVTKEEMEKMALENGLTLSQLRTQFNLMGLLIKDKGSTAESGKRYNSYQLTKKVDGRCERYYALKKSIKMVEHPVDESCAVDYSEELSRTPAEIALNEANIYIETLKETVKAKEAEICKILMERVDDTTQEELRRLF